MSQAAEHPPISASEPDFIGQPDLTVINNDGQRLLDRAVHHPLPLDKQPPVTSTDIRDLRQAPLERQPNQALSTMVLRLVGSQGSYRQHEEAVAAHERFQIELDKHKNALRAHKGTLAARRAAEAALAASSEYRSVSGVVAEYENRFRAEYHDPESGRVDIFALNKLYPDDLSHPGLDWLQRNHDYFAKTSKTAERVFRYILLNTDAEGGVS